MFEIGFVVRSGREQHDARIVAVGRRQGARVSRSEAKERRQPLHVALAKDRRERPR